MIEPDADLSWTFDLLAADPGRRLAALGRHHALLETIGATQRRINRIWHDAMLAKQPARVAELDQARAAQRGATAATLYGPISAFLRQRWHPEEPAPSAGPYAVLFLRWERRFPGEWREAGRRYWSPWGTKELLLHRFLAGGVPAAERDALGELVGEAVNGPYRCKDWLYAPLARLVAGPALRATLASTSRRDDPLARLRAEFVLHLLDRPELPVRRHTWRRWLHSRPA